MENGINWRDALVDDVMTRIKETGAAIILPKKATHEEVIKAGLIGVFEHIEELRKVAENALLSAANEAVKETEELQQDMLMPERTMAIQPGDMIFDETQWLEYLTGCKVKVHDDEVGRQLLKEAQESPEGFRNFVSSMVEFKDVVVPFLLYPGNKIFNNTGEHPKETAKSTPVIAKKRPVEDTPE